ncbi:hypothetical protein V8F33_014218, partial [Rhypophila sp. PSN 637]
MAAELQRVNQLNGQLLEQVTTSEESQSDLKKTSELKAALADISIHTTKELAKQSLHIPEKDRLSGPDNFQQWLQAISIQFTALQLEEFITDPIGTTAKLTKPQKAAVLLTLRNTLKSEPLATIAYETDPGVVFTRLHTQYAPIQSTLRTELWKEFHRLQYDGSMGLVAFNAKFNTLATRLKGLGSVIQEIDQLNFYFDIMEPHFPQWAERSRAALRHEQWATTHHLSSKYSLLYFQEDLLAETRNSVSNTYQQLQTLQANYKKKSKDKKFKEKSKNESNKKEFKKAKSKGSKLANEAFITGYNLETGNIYGELPELDQETFHSTDSKPWLFDTGSTVHICTDKSLFSQLELKSTLSDLRTGGGPVRPLGIGTARLSFFTGNKDNKPTYNEIDLLNTLYIPQFPLNIVSGTRLYKSGGTLIKQKLFS